MKSKKSEAEANNEEAEVNEEEENVLDKVLECQERHYKAGNVLVGYPQ